VGAVVAADVSAQAAGDAAKAPSAIREMSERCMSILPFECRAHFIASAVPWDPARLDLQRRDIAPRTVWVLGELERRVISARAGWLCRNAEESGGIVPLSGVCLQDVLEGASRTSSARLTTFSLTWLR